MKEELDRKIIEEICGVSLHRDGIIDVSYIPLLRILSAAHSFIEIHLSHFYSLGTSQSSNSFHVSISAQHHISFTIPLQN